ncbi:MULTISPECIES: aliphatic sulfonate ABC transporter substrate-binding protein [unclassified Hyphomicrobium]|uniref:aliphatic sulfonate ABC transporter substrate-binding protein n=1 Tax=unclassified Hyphomicrobium TaxID=2619925 RepID=UPI000213F831|nr:MULTISPECIES: aliphatic sulfonate ABC transporter substrate-binding protein [unclassified Hyphomicrobium]CCB63397.1 alkanesulfonate transport protein, periplasmic-binding subunit, ABC superfamily [Hyphomicrobium sp. MC1]
MDRRRLLQVAFALGITSSFYALNATAADRPTTVRIGYQKSSTLITVLRANGELEKSLARLGVKVKWSEFSSGLPLLEALNVGAIDLSGDVADTVPIFAQAAGAKLTYYASEGPSPAAQALIVAANSPIHSVADLRGKKVAVTKASGSHYFLIAALAKAGLKLKDIQPAYLTPADGRAAFEKGAVDAWVTWDPYVAAVEKQADARVLANGEGIASYQRYYLASSSFAAARSDVLKLVYSKLKETGEWVKQNPEAAAQILAPAWGLDSAVISVANSRRSYEIRSVSSDNLTEEQKIADTFFAERALPKRINSSEAQVWSLDKQASAQ